MMIAGLDSNRAICAQQNQSPEPRLVRAAHQFEGLMMKELLAPMKEASLEGGEGEQTGTLGEFACESLAGALSAGGGLGIANQIVHSFPGNLAGNSGLLPSIKPMSAGK
jgi:Rod binding domain-containing protein